MEFKIKLKGNGYMFERLQHTKVFRDPIHNYIEVDYKIILSCIDTADFQRLRRIHQLGGVFEVYHTAEHSRFSHSLGVYQIIRKMIEKVEGLHEALSQYDEVALLLAALLHDIGHGPFSHVFELVGNISHEEYTKRILLEDTEINKILSNADKNLPKSVADIISGDYKNKLCCDLISSQLDADRMDYLLRDSYFTGTAYGTFDIERILKTCFVRDGKLIVKESGVHAVEDYIMARYYMYWQVYYHKASRSYEIMLIKLIERIKDLLQENNEEVYKYHMFIALFVNEEINIHDYLDLDETVAGYGIYMMQKSKDVILRDLSTRLMNRILFKHGDEEMREEIEAALESRGSFRKYYFFEEVNSKVPYKPQYIPILIEGKHNEIKELSTCSAIISALVNNPNDIKTTIYYG